MARRRPPRTRSVPSQTGPSQKRTIRGTPQDNVRGAAAWVVERTLGSLSPVDSYLGTAMARYDERDQGLLQELVYGTLRWLRRLKQVIGDASSRDFERIEASLQIPLCVATYQLLFLDRIPAHAAVNEAVDQARRLSHRGAASFVNAVLRRIARDADPEAWPVRESDPVRRLAILHSHPDLLVERWLDRFGEQRTLEVLRANNRPKPLQLLAFRARGGREVLAEKLIDAGLGIEPSPVSPLGLTVRRGNPLRTAPFRDGEFYVQDEVSQIAALLVPPRPGERILDAAAAPGGKSFALWAAEPEVRLSLADVSPARLARLSDNLRRLNLSLPVFLADAGALPVDRPVFDRVVMDLPCSGTGTLRKNPELKWRLGPGEMDRLSAQGLRLLCGAGAAVRIGGYLLAITCSLEREENEEVIARFRARHPEFEPEDLRGIVPPTQAFGNAGDGFWRAFPDGDHDGFSVHVLRRIGP